MGIGKKIRDAIKKGKMKRGKRECLRRKEKHGESVLTGGCSIERQIFFGIRPESDRPKKVTIKQARENYRKRMTAMRLQETSKNKKTRRKL